ncbi:Uncharacterised protein [Mycobacteroides abscessus subsp. abscessus]|nr:Uncharacterised protein [Mycobacteroides abscessus subsp. abscessus]
MTNRSRWKSNRTTNIALGTEERTRRVHASSVASLRSATMSISRSSTVAAAATTVRIMARFSKRAAMSNLRDRSSGWLPE